MGAIRKMLQVVFSINVVFLLLLAVSFPFMDSDEGAYVVTSLALVPIVLCLAGSSVLIVRDWDPL